MENSADALKVTLKRWTLFLGVLQIAAGCIVGLIPPAAVPWYRGIVMAHIEFTANGVLMIVFGFLLMELALGAKALWLWFATLQIGTWTNGAAGVVTAFAGTSSKMMTTLNEKFPPPNGTNNSFATVLLITCGITILIALFITLYGLWPRRPISST